MMPPFLKPNDEIRIVSPSGTINPTYIDGAIKVLSGWGLSVTEGRFARFEYGRFAGTAEQRISDFQEALDDINVKAILCSRGGYGLAQIVDKLDFTHFSQNPKWLIGFSDITILHTVITNLGFASIHGIMAKHLTELTEDAELVLNMRKLLFGELPVYNITGHIANRVGEAKGKLVGGNLSVFMGLRGSIYDIDFEGKILFIEDIAEQPYHIDRMMQNLRFSGALSKISGLVVGQFSDCEEDPKMKQTVVEIILDAVKEYQYPVCFNFPSGHVDYNLALILGAEVELKVDKIAVQLKF